MATPDKTARETVDVSLAERRRSHAIASISPQVSSDNLATEAAFLENKIQSLKHLVLELHQELESLTKVQSPSVELGIDFYDEVKRFEIEMIKRALKLMGGHQSNAARLLNLKANTLNSKIKQYQIRLGLLVFFKEAQG